MPWPSSRTSIIDAASGVACDELNRALARLVRTPRAARARSSPWSNGVADEVGERVAERVDDGAVELGLGPDELELDLFTGLGREVADQAGEAQEDDVRPGSCGPA